MRASGPLCGRHRGSSPSPALRPADERPFCPPRGSSHGTMFCRTAGVRRPIVWTLPRANFARQMSQFVLRP
jgi:hypothetical protein